MIGDIIKALLEAGKKAPACLAISMMTAALLWLGVSTQYASAEDMEKLREEIGSGFEQLISRMNVSDAEREVSDVQSQIRQKEREIADLEMVLAGMTDDDAAALLRSRIFSLQQDLTELRAKLSDRSAQLQEARRAYQPEMR